MMMVSLPMQLLVVVSLTITVDAATVNVMSWLQSDTSFNGRLYLMEADTCRNISTLEAFDVGAPAQSVHAWNLAEPSSNKVWIVPEGLKDWDCKLDCLDCFYIGANVGPDGNPVVGFGYGQNAHVPPSDPVASMLLTMVRADTGDCDSVKCTTDQCIFDHIIPGKRVSTVNIELGRRGNDPEGCTACTGSSDLVVGQKFYGRQTDLCIVTIEVISAQSGSGFLKLVGEATSPSFCQFEADSAPFSKQGRVVSVAAPFLYDSWEYCSDSKSMVITNLKIFSLPGRSVSSITLTSQSMDRVVV